MIVSVQQRNINMIEKIKTITNTLNGYLNGRTPFLESQNELSTVFLEQPFFEFLDSLQNNSIKINNQILVITVLGYLLYKNESESEIVSAINEKNLEKTYFGGIKKLLLGHSKLFSAKVYFDDSGYDNKLRFINTYELDYYRLHLIFSACKILGELSRDDFEKIIVEDGAVYYLWAVYIGFIDFKPSEEFLKKLINSDSELQRSISFGIIVNPIENYIYGKTNEDINEIILNKLLDEFYTVLDEANAEYSVSLLVNYLLMKKHYPVSFIQKITQDKYVELLCNIIAKTNTIKLVQELENLSSGIFKYSGNSNEKINEAISKCLIKLFENRSLLFNFEKNQKCYVDSILKGLSKPALISLKEYFIKYDKDLMISELDSMVRYEMYNKDIQKHKCIELIENDINENTTIIDV